MFINESMTPEVSIIIVSWNGRNHLEACLSSIANQREVNIETILVDNGSTDQTVEFVQEKFPWVRLVCLDSNRGFAGGNNAGACEARGQYLVFLNNDTVVESGWLRALQDGLNESHGFVMSTSRIVYMHDPSKIDSAGDGMTRAGGAFKRLHGYPVADALESCEVFGACGGACLIVKSVIDELGGFDEDFFLSHEDVDLSYRARLLGYRCRYVSNAVVRHHSSATLGRRSRLAIFHSQRNLEWVYFKNTPLFLLFWTLPSHFIYNLVAAVHFTRLGFLDTFLSAKINAFFGFRQILRKRFVVQRSRKLSVRTLLRFLEPRWLSLKLREEYFDQSLGRDSFQ